MANKDDSAEYRSVTGQTETAEPASNSSASSTTTAKRGSDTQSTISTQKSSQSSTTTAPLATARKSSLNNVASLASPTSGQSPRTSRNTSPIRKDKPVSVSGSLSLQPSAAAIQRALSASNVQQLKEQQQQQSPSAASDSFTRNGREQKSASASGSNTPQWPTSPRLKSPPPSATSSRRTSSTTQKKTDAAPAPGISVQNATPRDSTPAGSSARDSRSDPGQQLAPPSSTKTPSRGPSGKSVLETVQENSTDAIAEPSPAAVQASADLKPLTKITGEDGQPAKRARSEKHTQPGESGSESAGTKSDGASRSRRASATQSTNPLKPKSTALKANYPQSAKRHSEGKQNMTVETEVVPSIPQSTLNAGERNGRAEGGSVRLKPSNETIRPKKERKKNDRKIRSVNQGTATSKADLFEARVASAVDEANTSDSDETFVYESNPPEPQRRQRHHSRTPSVTSSHSTADQQRGAIRSFGEAFDDRRVGGKRSMKFSSNPFNDMDSPENNGTVRSHTPRHIGRFGRGGHHSASYDPDSPFTQAQKGRTHHLSAQARSRPTSPKSPQSIQYRAGGLFGKKSERAYDFDAEQNADDEQTPLLGSIRGPRGFRGRRPNSSLSSSVDYSHERRRYCSGRTGACLLSVLIVVAVVASAIFFAFASNRPLQDVKIRKIQNVLASEQELIFDLLVGAVNPNTLGISVNDMNVDIFAKSKHAIPSKPLEGGLVEGRGSPHRSRADLTDYNPSPSQDPAGHWHAPDPEPGHDHGTDPDDDLEREPQTMLLGRVFHFDQGLTFEASPIKNHEHHSSGLVQLMKPGNHTETGGSERWHRVIQYPFELIVRGVLKYQLPISAHIQTAAVEASIMVHPEDGIDSLGNMRTEPVEHRDHWQWIDWPTEVELKEQETEDDII